MKLRKFIFLSVKGENSFPSFKKPDHIMGTRIDYSKKEKHDRFTKLILKTKKVAQKGLEATKPIKIPFQTIQ